MAGQRFVITGLGRLTTRVASHLRRRGAEVVVVAGRDEAGGERLLPDGIRVVWSDGDREDALRRADLPGAQCLLVLGTDDLENVNATAAAHAVAPDVPVVLRAFDPVLAEQLEAGLNVRRAFSVSALAAPAFVAAAVGEEVLQTLRLGDADVPLCTVTVRSGSDLDGRRDDEIQARYGAALIAHAPPGASWHPSEGDRPVGAGDRVLAGGLQGDVLRLLVRNSGLFGDRGRRGPGGRRRSRPVKAAAAAGSAFRGTLLPVTAAALILVLAANMLAFGLTLHLDPIDALYRAVTTAFGDPGLDRSQAWLKIFAVTSMVTGGALVGVFFSLLASVATTERLEERMGRRAGRLSGHVVIVGLGNVGYRLHQALLGLGIEMVVVEGAPDHFAELVREHTPLILGDGRLAENLERAGVPHAAALIACAGDDLVNLAAGVQAERLNPEVRTVVRIFDEGLAERAATTFAIDHVVSTTLVAARAFVGAALDERAVRSFVVGDLPYLALRLDVTEPVDAAALRDWYGAGIRVVALRRGTGPVLPPSELGTGLAPGDSAVVTGPEEPMRALVLAGQG